MVGVNQKGHEVFTYVILQANRRSTALESVLQTPVNASHSQRNSSKHDSVLSRQVEDDVMTLTSEPESDLLEQETLKFVPNCAQFGSEFVWSN